MATTATPAACSWSARTSRAERLSQVTQECLYKSLEIVKEGTRLSDIGKAIQAHAEANGYSVVRDFCGHGIGKNFHEEPQVLHYDGYDRHNDLVLKEGMALPSSR